jgi:dynein heavy chain, axonemal
MMLESLIVMNVHTADVTEEVLLKHNVTNKADFEWIKQMRHYVTEEKIPKNP